MKEQEHQQPRHTTQENSRREHSPERRNHEKSSPETARRLGQVFGLIYNLALIYLVCDLAKSGDNKAAVAIFAINAALILFAIAFVRRSKKHSNNDRRGGRNFRPQNRERREPREDRRS